MGSINNLVISYPNYNVNTKIFFFINPIFFLNLACFI
jgi:hypothetical protein